MDDKYRTRDRRYWMANNLSNDNHQHPTTSDFGRNICSGGGRHKNDRNDSRNHFKSRPTYPPTGLPERFRSRPHASKESSETSNRNDFKGIKRKFSPHVGFKYVESMINQPVEEVMTKILDNQGFYSSLEKEMSPDYTVLIVKLIRKFCECEFTSLRVRVMQKTFCPSFLTTLHLYISTLPFQRDKKRNSYFWNDPDSFWNNLIKICKVAIKEMPQNYCESLSTLLKLTDGTLPQFESAYNTHISDNIKEELKSLIQTTEAILLEFEKKERAKKIVNLDEGEPPDNFREISVYPTSIELINNQRPFLRKNVVQGPYRDVEHYLDVQYRLLREDFVGPLREGIKSYQSDTKTKIQNVKIHKKVHFLNPIAATEHYCVLLQFNFSKTKTSFRYEHSRRFMYGSLVCFTNNNFKSLIFGRIVDRDEKYLKNGEIVIGFDRNEEILYNTDYVMVECTVYFEPYYHVLSVMKELSEEDFPMQNYIIDVETVPRLPNYISPDISYRMMTRDRGLVTWQPYTGLNVDFHNFNPSQNAAFIAALTRQFAIIQGPPGTGKTFVGLKIAKTLLRNYEAWYKRTPMLVICYTNHALDQFLEGLLGTTEHILRIGGQSKNEKLKKFNLRSYSCKMTHSTFEAKKRVSDCISEIKTITETLSMIRRYDCIIDFKMFGCILPTYRYSWLSNATNEDMLDWLLETKQPYQRGQVQTLVEKIGNEENKSGEDEDDGYKDEEDKIVRDEDLWDVTIAEICNPLLNLPELQQVISRNNRTLKELEYKIEKDKNYDFIFEYTDLEMKTKQMIDDYEYVKNKLDRAARGELDLPNDLSVENSQYISRPERWHLYFYWLNELQGYLMHKIEEVNANFREAYQIYSESKDLENIRIFKDMMVIGITTTGAARLHSSLQMIKSPIVIVEEAAEVLEAHIITSLTKDCQQLILIGDHQQLKPSTSNYQVEKFYHLGISLFERMILNNVQCFTLNVQHRMRPEISALIKPAIYPNLIDHESVRDRPQILGMDKCLYFINHNHPEESGVIETSKKNMYEVKYLILLAKYLVLNGYRSDQITIIAAYLGQMFELQKERTKYAMYLKDVRIAVLDNYQGEECDIILLSLVRNNADKKVGFLSIENRVCVALSRARIGLYVMGNMEMLCEKSDLWCQIKETLVAQEAFGSTLSLKCQNHNKITNISKADDFMSVVEGGCDQICKALLICGHNCQRLCHILDREHMENKCQENCEKLLCDTNPLHVCKKKCYQECGPCCYIVSRDLNCGHKATMECFVNVDTYNCEVQVPATLPCAHETMKPCYITPEDFRCPFMCDVRLDCGHACTSTCHLKRDPDHLVYRCLKPCGKPRIGCTNEELENHRCPKLCFDDCLPCKISVQKTRTLCPHLYWVPCNLNVDELKCHKPCVKKLPCGHKCKQECHAPCGNCTEKVEKIIPDCNHKCKINCCEEADRKYCKGKCPRIMSCGHACQQKCYEACDPLKCKVMTDVSIQAKCGHIIKQVPCKIKTLYVTGGNIDNLESYCTEPCKQLLNCGPKIKHQCTGNCGECSQGRIHKRCTDKCGRPLVCNHECEVKCRETCKPCPKSCSYKCRHSACKKRCGQPCPRCKERCFRQCQHQKCTKACGDICNVPPCEMPCAKRLKCGHRCIGFCGDPCPPLCRFCNKTELEEIFFGTEDKEDARFVWLIDCQHIVESSGMEQWMKQDENEIKFKVCPKCKTTLYKTERYIDYVKRAIADVEKVKIKEYGTREQIGRKRKEVHDKVEELRANFQSVYIFAQSSATQNINVLLSRLRQVTLKGQALNLSVIELETHHIKYQLLQDILNTWTNNVKDIIITSNYTEKISLQLAFIFKHIFRDSEDITSNEIEDINREISRLNRIIQFGCIMSTPQALMYKSKSEVVKAESALSDWIFSLSTYDNTIDKNVKQKLVDLNKFLASSVGVTEAEKQQIVRAIGLTRGHWFKCRNGHPYAIGECGGAMELGLCHECKAPIGGRNHALIQGNTLATEMDGARHAAWSDAQNLGNYMNLMELG